MSQGRQVFGVTMLCNFAGRQPGGCRSIGHLRGVPARDSRSRIGSGALPAQKASKENLHPPGTTIAASPRRRVINLDIIQGLSKIEMSQWNVKPKAHSPLLKSPLFACDLFPVDELDHLCDAKIFITDLLFVVSNLPTATPQMGQMGLRNPRRGGQGCLGIKKKLPSSSAGPLR